MRRNLDAVSWSIGILLFLFVVATSSADSLNAYRLAAGDRVGISVFGEPDLSVDARVSDRGTISYPLLGELRVGGITLDDLERLIASRLRGPYLVDPKVTVSIEEYRQFFVMGQVNRPGGYPFLPGLTVRKAVSVAGGFTERASRDKILVISEVSPTRERRVNQQHIIGPGDTIVVKESFF